MTKIVQWVPSYCSFKVTIDKPDNWDDMSLEEKKEYFAQNMNPDASLCWQCSEEIQSDLELSDELYYREEYWDEKDFQEEEE